LYLRILTLGVEKIRQKLGWQARCSDLETIIATAWQWHQGHPLGYAEGDEQ